MFLQRRTISFSEVKIDQEEGGWGKYEEYHKLTLHFRSRICTDIGGYLPTVSG